MTTGPSAAVWTHVEMVGRRPTRATGALLAQARRLGNDVTAYCLSRSAPDAAETLARLGATRVCAVGAPDEALAGPPVAAAMAARIDASDRPDVVLFPATHDGRDAGGRLSARIDRPVITGADVVVVDGQLCVDTPVFDGDTVVRTACTGPAPYLVLLRAGSAAGAEPLGPVEGDVEVVDLAADPPAATGRARVVAFHSDVEGDVGLEDAAVVVAGGRGIGSAEGFEQLQDLARLLGGATAATGAAVDGGLAPDAWLVGQSGRSVRPEVYLAFGISGASQHLAGTSGARHLIAVNTDRHAPIFAAADLGVVGDARSVASRLLDAVRARRAGGGA